LFRKARYKHAYDRLLRCAPFLRKFYVDDSKRQINEENDIPTRYLTAIAVQTTQVEYKRRKDVMRVINITRDLPQRTDTRSRTTMSEIPIANMDKAERVEITCWQLGIICRIRCSG
jgi:hypothetical protein